MTMDRFSFILPVGFVAAAWTLVRPDGHATALTDVAVTSGVAGLVLAILMGAEALARRGSNRERS